MAREDTEVDFLLQIKFNLFQILVDLGNAASEENHGATGTSQGFVSGSGDNIGVFEWTRENTSSNKTYNRPRSQCFVQNCTMVGMHLIYEPCRPSSRHPRHQQSPSYACSHIFAGKHSRPRLESWACIVPLSFEAYRNQ